MLKVQSEMKNIPTINLDNKGLLHWLYLHSSGIVCVVKGEVRSLAEREKTNAGDKNMSTHAAIGIAQADGTIKAIYLHNDGYPSPERSLPDGIIRQKKQKRLLLLEL